MIIKENMKFGLYGQILTWILEILPYLERNNIKPIWDITSPYYGDIFGKHILLNYTPDNDNFNSNLTDIKMSNGHHFGNDFELANKMWYTFFKFSPYIINKVDKNLEDLDMAETIGIHYRGTDKIETEGGYINTQLFTKIVDDYLKSKNQIKNIIILTDEKKILLELKKHYEDNYNVIYDKELYESNHNDILFFNNIKNSVDIDKHYEQALIDTITLSKCSLVFKTASALSAWAKILNPNIEIYRISSFIHDWFPDSRIPLYESSNLAIEEILKDIYKKEKIK